MMIAKTVCALRTEVSADPQVIEAAERLAALLVGTQAFQEYSRLSRAVRRDPQAADIMRHLNACSYPSDVLEEPAYGPDELEARLESLKVVKAFRDAESQVRALFGAADSLISREAGAPFAENVRASGYG